MNVKTAAMTVDDFHVFTPSTAVKFEGLVQQPSLVILSCVLTIKGATICGAPGRWGLSIRRARSTKVERPPFTSRIVEIRCCQFSSFCWCRTSGMRVYEELKLALVQTFNPIGLIYCGKCGGAMTGTRKSAGRNKNMYVSYECSTLKRTKACDMKAINKNYAENIVIEHLEKNVFSPEAIETLVSKITEYAASQSKEISQDIKIFTDQLSGVQTEINKIVNAIAAGMFYQSMKEKNG